MNPKLKKKTLRKLSVVIDWHVYNLLFPLRSPSSLLMDNKAIREWRVENYSYCAK